jgi:hypothetical protein
MDDDFDVDEFDTPGDFVTTAELRTGGPQVKRIARVERGAGFKDKNGKPQPELVLVFSDGRKAGLRAKVNRLDLKEAYGARTHGWIGQTIELYCDKEVRNPSGAKVGGIRLRAMAAGAAVSTDDFASDLDDVLEDEKNDVPF